MGSNPGRAAMIFYYSKHRFSLAVLRAFAEKAHVFFFNKTDLAKYDTEGAQSIHVMSVSKRYHLYNKSSNIETLL